MEDEIVRKTMEEVQDKKNASKNESELEFDPFHCPKCGHAWRVSVRSNAK